MPEFEYKSLLAKRKMTLEELKLYYRELRKYDCENNIPIKGIEIRKKIYKLIQLILKIDRLISKRTLTIIGDQRTSTDKTKIYAATHIGRYDIESAIESIGEATWMIMGDPGETYRNIDGLLLRIHGVSWFDMEDRYDAHTVNVRQKKVLSNGGNELSFPEAAWNIDPIKPMGDVHPGIIRRAISTNSVIIPIAMEQYCQNNKLNYYVNIGKVLDYTGAQISDAPELAEELKEYMASLKWDIWEKYGQCSRKDLHESWTDGYKEFITNIMKYTENGYTIEEIEKTKYINPLKEKFEEPVNAFSYLTNLSITKETAFIAKDILEQKVINNEKEKQHILKKT